MSGEIRLEMTGEELQQWMNYDSTRTVFKFLGQIRDHYRDQLASGATLTMASVENTAMQTSLLLGQISGLNTILELQIDE